MGNVTVICVLDACQMGNFMELNADNQGPAILCLSACQDHQVAAQVVNDKVNGSALTNTLLKHLKGSSKLSDAWAQTKREVEGYEFAYEDAKGSGTFSQNP